MTQVPSGLLPALIAYYRRLEADPDQGVAEYGFSREKIHFAGGARARRHALCARRHSRSQRQGQTDPQARARPRRRGPFRDRDETLLLLGQHGLCPGAR